MTAVEQYLEELGRILHTRGRSRRRLLAECSDHLSDAREHVGDDEAVRRFGSAADLASSFDTEIAVRRAARATTATIVGVLAVGASTLVLINAADPGASAVLVWTVIFFGSAQVAAVCVLLAALLAAAMRQRPATAADAALLCRRNGTALAFSAVTLFAAGAAVPGHTAAWAVLTGPVVACPAGFGVIRARSLARKLDPRPSAAVHPPLADLVAVAHHPLSRRWAAPLSPVLGLLVPTVAVATLAAFLWDHLDHGSTRSSVTAAGLEAALTIAGFVLLGPVLGLLPARRRSRGETAA